jgi:hypothetical protein
LLLLLLSADYLFPNQHSLNEVPPAAAAGVDDGRLLAKLTLGAKKTFREWAEQKHVGHMLLEENECGKFTLHWQ